MKLEYDSISPITGNKCVLIEADEKTNSESFLCMESGFSSFDKLIEGSNFQQNYEDRCTDLMIACKVIDENNLAWYPTFMQLPGGMLYSDGTSHLDWHWKVARVISLNEEEQKQYPIIGKEGEYHTSRLDVDNAIAYDNNNFQEALDELYNIVRETITNEN